MKIGITAVVDFITEEARETSHKVSFQAEAVVQGPGCVSVLLAQGREHHQGRQNDSAGDSELEVTTQGAWGWRFQQRDRWAGLCGWGGWRAEAVME